MVRFSFAGHDMMALTSGALFWPARRALIVADLHFEKASWFARTGQMLPPYDSLATLADLDTIVARTDAAEIWCLGDSFHDDGGVARLPDAARAILARLMRHTRWCWITGNHDAAIDDCFGAPHMAEAEVDGLLLRHEAEAGETRPELSGHFHPKFAVALRGRRVSRRCFIAGRDKLILPAFGALAGGLDAGHAAIRRLTGPGAEALIPLDDRLLRFPIAA